ncbi:MAG: hypothetical protein NT016_02105 [Candidatus Aenigmarchaeota archaeon]|nr:hypothetical protein [Candidatus Aenigmarchaeota archaeon]
MILSAMRAASLVLEAVLLLVASYVFVDFRRRPKAYYAALRKAGMLGVPLMLLSFATFFTLEIMESLKPEFVATADVYIEDVIYILPIIALSYMAFAARLPGPRRGAR